MFAWLLSLLLSVRHSIGRRDGLSACLPVCLPVYLSVCLCVVQAVCPLSVSQIVRLFVYVCLPLLAGAISERRCLLSDLAGTQRVYRHGADTGSCWTFRLREEHNYFLGRTVLPSLRWNCGRLQTLVETLFTTRYRMGPVERKTLQIFNL